MMVARMDEYPWKWKDVHTEQAYLEQQEQLIQLMKGSDSLPEGGLLGGLLSFQVGEGHAYYIVTKARPLTVSWIPYMEGWRVAKEVITSLTVKKINDIMERDKGRRKIFPLLHPTAITASLVPIDMFNTQYLTAFQAWENRYDAIQKKKEEMEKELAQIGDQSRKMWVARPGLTAELFEPLAKALLLYLPGRKYEVVGPFGIACEFSIWFIKSELAVNDPKRLETGNCLSISFRHQGDELFVVDHLSPTKEYGPNTLGAINGLNYPTISTKGKSFQWMIEFIEKQNRK